VLRMIAKYVICSLFVIVIILVTGACRLLSWLPKLRPPSTSLKMNLFTRNESMFALWGADKLRPKVRDIHIGTGNAFLEAEDFLADLKVSWPFFLATGDDGIIALISLYLFFVM
jgi:hypothetical protein